jgi:hypothetical protein
MPLCSERLYACGHLARANRKQDCHIAHRSSTAEVAIKENESDTLQAPFEVGVAQAGNPLPIGGAHQYGDGVNFVLFSRHATRVDGVGCRGGGFEPPTFGL